MMHPDYLWLNGLRERMMRVLVHMNSSNFGQALSMLHDTILGYDNMMRYIQEQKRLGQKKKRKRRLQKKS